MQAICDQRHAAANENDDRQFHPPCPPPVADQYEKHQIEPKLAGDTPGIAVEREEPPPVRYPSVDHPCIRDKLRYGVRRIISKENDEDEQGCEMCRPETGDASDNKATGTTSRFQRWIDIREDETGEDIKERDRIAEDDGFGEMRRDTQGAAQVPQDDHRGGHEPQRRECGQAPRSQPRFGNGRDCDIRRCDEFHYFPTRDRLMRLCRFMGRTVTR